MRKLTSKDLMSGDWVNWNGSPLKISSMDIESLYFSEDILAEREDVTPILITPDILLTSGFSGKCLTGDSTIPIRYHFRKLGFTLFYDFKYDNTFTCKNFRNGKWLSMEIRYIHELQHALKLCEINMEIKL